MIWRYVINGLCATFIHYIVLIINIEIFLMQVAAIANLVASLFGITASFLGNKFFVFKNKDSRLVNQFFIFTSLYLSIATIHGVTMFFWADKYGYDYRIGFILASIIQFALSYFGNKFIVFKT